MQERTIFLDALEKDDPAERAAYLDEACGGDLALRQRVEALLQSHAQAGDFPGKLAPERVAEELGLERQGGTTLGEAPPSDKTAEEDLSFLAPADKAGSLGRLGHYDVQEIVGRGGMGVVLRAFDEKLHRVVAVKVIGAQLAVSGTGRERFVREARAAAAVRDEHVVGIHAVEQTGDLPYLVMEYVAGQSLQERLDRVGPLAPKEVLRIGLQIAQGLAAAHKHGLVHRDIKPSNILLENGVERVKITDFGLARAMDDASLTQSGVISGTPQYMAPEQAHGEAVDQRADLFSLGSVLYAMCTGRPPFRASGTMAVLKRVCEETPRPIRETNPDVPDWLVGIIDKLHAKDPAGRYQTAAEVAELLNQCLAHLQQPLVVPLPMTRPARLPSAWRRSCLVAAVVLLGLAVVTMVGLLMPRGTPVAGADDSNEKVGVEGPAPTNVLTTSGALRRFKGHTRYVWSVAYSADGRHALSGAADSTVRLWDIGTGKELHCFERHTGGVTGVAISSDGRFGLSSGGDGYVILWNLETGKEVRRCDKHTAPLYCVAISPDDKVAVAGTRGAIISWDVKTGKQLRRFKGHKDCIFSVAFSPDGRYILSGGGAESKHPYPPDADLSGRWWNVKTGEELTKYKGHTLWIQCVAVSPDGHSALSGSYDGTIRLWDIQAGKQLRCFNHPSGVGAVAFSPKGQYFLSGGDSPYHVYLRDLKTGKQLHRFEGHTHKIQSLAFSPDGKTFLSGSWDGTMRLWQLPELDPVKAARPVVLMHFDEADFYQKDGKTYVRDRSGNGHDGLCEQVHFTPEGKAGGGLANAGKGFLRLPTSFVTSRSHFTIAGWVKPATLKKGYAFYTCVHTDYPARVQPNFNFFHNGNYLYVGVWNIAHGWMHVQSPEQNVSPGEWAFIAATLENGATGKGRVRHMLNDRICERPSQQVGGVPLEGINDIAALNLNGVLDELAVWDRALSDQELKELFALGHAPAGKAPAAADAAKAKSP
jgi:WD40 repeat protein